ncbi:hypothetical protein BC830DRAFT_1131633 [Chytriomyces sp. MP71]|nr:hypothetical protein BC830DRAFT_1131633 [Chytriomyces sp. MP71]
MSDLTLVFTQLVQGTGSGALPAPRPPASNKKDPFVAEADAVGSQLAQLSRVVRLIAPAFLRLGVSGAAVERVEFGGEAARLFGVPATLSEPLDGADRDRIAATVALFLETAQKRVALLAQAASAATVRASQNKSTNDAFGALLASLGAAPSREALARHDKVLAEHRSSIVWVLQRRLVDTSTTFRSMQEQWIEVQTRRDDGYLNILKKKSATVSRSPSPTRMQLMGVAAGPLGTNLLSGITVGLSTVNRAAKMATTIAHSQLESIVGASVSGGGAKPGDSEGWDDDGELEFPPPLNKDNAASPHKEIAKGGNTWDTAKFDHAGGLRHRGRGGAIEVDGADSRATPKIPDRQFNPTMDEEADRFLASLSGEQRMILENENEQLLAQFESGLDQIRTATQSIQTISNLQSQMVHHLQVQEKQIQGLQEDAWQATEDVQAANLYLNNAKKLFAESRVWLLAFFVIASLSLLFLDWYYG